MRMVTRTLLEAVGSGLAGALTVASLNESLRRRKLTVPQLQIVGQRAVRKGSRSLGLGRPSREFARKAGIGGLILDATLFFSLVRIGRYPRPVMRGALLGALAGVSAIFAPRVLRLGKAPVALTPRMKALTFGYYFTGGLVAGLVGRAFAETRAMTRHPLRTAKRRLQRSRARYTNGAHPPEQHVAQTEEARF